MFFFFSGFLGQLKNKLLIINLNLFGEFQYARNNYSTL